MVSEAGLLLDRTTLLRYNILKIQKGSFMNSEKYMSHAVVSLISAKGGVGTSTLTKELAIAFSKDVSVCLVDMALSCPAQETLFRILPTRTMEYLFKHNAGDLSPLYWQDLEPYLTPVPGRNIHLLSAKQVKGAYHLPLNRIIQLISSLKTYFDLILIDTDMASTDASAKLMEMSDLALLITDDTECSIRNNQRFRRLLTQKQVSYDHMHVIVNQIRKEQRMYSDQEIEELLHIPVLITLPYYDQVWKYNNSYLSLYEDPVSPLQPSLSSLVDRLSKLLEK